MFDREDNVYIYEIRYLTHRLLVRVCRCHSHDRCQHRFKIRTIHEEATRDIFRLEHSGAGGLIEVEFRRRGIHPSLIVEVDSLLNLGWGATQLRSMLLHRYSEQPRMLRMFRRGGNSESARDF